jgi:protein-S-isoprenylcysteine O-methyltransferase Ste14
MGLRTEMQRQGDWLFRWRSFLPLLFVPPLIVAIHDMHWPLGSHEAHQKWEIACLTISFLGLAVRVMTVGCTPKNTSGRNTKDGQVAESLNTSGIYSVVRHPLYVGNFLIGLGAVMLPMQWWVVGVYTLSFWLYYERIMMAEEAFLRHKFGDAYDRWVAATPAFIPNPRLWRAPNLSFSPRNALKREYTALTLAVLLHVVIEVGEHLVIDRRLTLEPRWVVILASTLAVYFGLRFLKKHTALLQVEGR